VTSVTEARRRCRSMASGRRLRSRESTSRMADQWLSVGKREPVGARSRARYALWSCLSADQPVGDLGMDGLYAPGRRRPAYPDKDAIRWRVELAQEGRPSSVPHVGPDGRGCRTPVNTSSSRRSSGECTQGRERSDGLGVHQVALEGGVDLRGDSATARHGLVSAAAKAIRGPRYIAMSAPSTGDRAAAIGDVVQQDRGE